MPFASNHESFLASVDQTNALAHADGAALAEAWLEHRSLKDQIAQQTQLMHLLTHQLATPLTALGGSVPLLAEASLEAAQRQEFLEVVQQQVQRLKHLLQTLMALRDLETGALEPQPICFCLQSLIEDVMAGFHEPQVSAQCSPDLPLVWGDRWQISQILVNLLSNAIKYSPDGSPIEIGAERQQPDGQQPGWVNVWVRDRGLGIPAADQPHLFEQFYRVQHRDRHTIKGTGLGLSLCKLLAENQGGQLHVTSTHGEGSCFSFTLPTDAKASGNR